MGLNRTNKSFPGEDTRTKRRRETNRQGRFKRWEDYLADAIQKAEKASGKAEREKEELKEWKRRKDSGLIPK